MARSHDLSKRINDLWRILRKQGWKRETTGGGHYKWTAPDGGFTFTSATPRCPYSLKKIEAHLKELGADF